MRYRSRAVGRVNEEGNSRGSNVKIGIGSYSFHRLLASGEHDMFSYITDCKALGATQLEPWNGHLEPIRARDDALKAAGDAEGAKLDVDERAYLARVREVAAGAGLPFGCLAVDGAHVYEPTEEARRANRIIADRWLAVAEALGASQIRIDSGGPEDMPEEVFDTIVAGYADLVERACVRGVEVIMENHWGASCVPENVVRILEAVEGLGLLFDTGNWAEGTAERGWTLCAKYARSTHFKTFVFDEDGNETTADIPRAVGIVAATGYDGCWGVESCPTDGDEYGAARKTIALIKRALGEVAATE